MEEREWTFFFFSNFIASKFFDDNDDYAVFILYVVLSVLSFVLRIPKNPN